MLQEKERRQGERGIQCIQGLQLWGLSRLSTAKANIAIAQDDIICLLDPYSTSDDNNSSDIQCVFTLRTGDNDGMSDKWLLDSGALHIMCSHCKWFSSFTHLPKPINIILGDNHTILATGQGQIVVSSNMGNKHSHIILQDVLYMPDMSRNLLLVSHFMQCRGELHFAGEM